jgi:L-alanine-DL-glutamate epimerase-like enolase superfamily enzyme
MARQSFIVKFSSNAALEVFRERIQAAPEYKDLRVHFFHDPPDVVIQEIDSARVARLKEVAGNSAQFIADFAHDMF